MNGPTPEAEAKIKSNPKSNRTATIGTSHQSLRFHKNANNSPTTPKFDVMLRIKLFIFNLSFLFVYVFVSTTINRKTPGNTLKKNLIS
jgi:hypothetical protein